MFLCFSFFHLLLLLFLKESIGKYDCEEDGITYTNRRFNDAPPEYRDQKWGLRNLKTDTWQECQEICEGVKQCKGFVWYKKKTLYPKACTLFSTHKGKTTFSHTVSGLKECEFTLKGLSKVFADALAALESTDH